MGQIHHGMVEPEACAIPAAMPPADASAAYAAVEKISSPIREMTARIVQRFMGRIAPIDG